MLNKETFIKGIQLMNTIIIKQVDTDDTFEIYYMLLKDLDSEAYMSGLIHLCKTKQNIHNPFSPAEIIEASKLFTKIDETTEKIITQIEFDILKYGVDRKPLYKQEIEEAINRAGGWYSICLTENEYEKKEIFKILKESIDLAVKDKKIFLAPKTEKYLN